MARKQIFVVTCDLCGKSGDECTFPLNKGNTVVLDLCTSHEADFSDGLEALRPLLDMARPAPATRARAASAQSRGTAKAAKDRISVVREWAAANGHPESGPGKRGRIPAAITAEYEASKAAAS